MSRAHVYSTQVHTIKYRQCSLKAAKHTLAVRSQDGRVPRKPTHSGTARGKRKKQTEPTAAAARQGQAFYGIFPIEAILNRAPLQKPFDWDAEKDGAWDPERKPLKTRGWFEYDDDIAFDLYAWKCILREAALMECQTRVSNLLDNR